MKTITSLFLAGIILASCGGGNNDQKLTDALKSLDSLASHEAKPSGPPVEITFADMTNDSLKDRDVILTGYLRVPMFTSSSNGSARLELAERPNQTKGTTVSIYVKTGSGKNTMVELQDKFKYEDLKVTGKNNDKIGYNDRVKIKGRFNKYSNVGSIEVVEIEKLEEASPDYSTLNAVKLNKENMNDTNLSGKLVYTEGVFELPVLVFMDENMALDLKKTGLAPEISAYVMIGKGKSQVEQLPENYEKKDLKLYDNKGTLIPAGKKTRVYGIWNIDTTDGRGTLYVEEIITL